MRLKPPTHCGGLRPGELMSRIFITGSTDGLGLMAAELLLKDGHQVTLHARSQARNLSGALWLFPARFAPLSDGAASAP